MNWKNLKDSKCPDCESRLLFCLRKNTQLGCATGSYYACEACDFKIGKEKFDKIVNDLYKPRKFKTDEERFSDLNNLGRKKVSEDFSDSHFLD